MASLIDRGAWNGMMRCGFYPILLLALCACLFQALAARAQGEPPPLRAALIAATQSVGPRSGKIAMGLAIDVPRGWKIYWRTPGAPGLPPTLDWAGSGNLAKADMAWPAPRRLEAAGLVSNGYEGQVVFPLDVVLREPGKALSARARLSLAMCSDICVPETVPLSLDLPAGDGSPSMNAPLIAAAEKTVPVPVAPGADSSYGIARFVLSDDGLGLEVDVASAEALEKPEIFVETGNPEQGFTQRFAPSPPPEPRAGTMTRFVLKLAEIGDDPGDVEARRELAALVGKPETLTLVEHPWGGARAVEFTQSLQASRQPAAAATVSAPESPARAAAGSGRLAIALIALLGGLILNLMPCVLPVLSIKLLHVLRAAGAERKRARAQFLASAAGILATFLALAGIAAAVRAGGALIDWGWQFQSPAFLVFMIALLALFACNLAGVFEIALPAHVVERLDSVTRGHKGLAGDFGMGLFAVLMATPCSAPFVGTALGYALSRGPFDILLVFFCLGLGLAAPYLALAAFPSLVGFLPRPGRWMIVLRRCLALALAATAIWLGCVLVAEISADGVSPGARSETNSARARTADWRPFDPAALRELVAGGHTVLVDVTAAWCLSCKANEVFVLDALPLADLQKSGRLDLMRADWTHADPAIGAYLAGFGRYGIPFNAVYGPAAPEGIPLPELLTPGLVKDAIARASGKDLPPQKDVPN